MEKNLERRAVGHLLGTEISRKAAERLTEYGLIDRSRAEQYLLWREVKRLAARGHGRCEAMILTGRRMACSYEKARNAFYTIEKIRRNDEL